MTQPVEVSDKSANKEETIKHTAEVIGRSKARKKAFEIIYFGKTRWKPVSYIVSKSGMQRKTILVACRKLYDQHIVTRTKIKGEFAYGRNNFIATHKNKILKIAGKRSEIEKIPTKRDRFVGSIRVVKVQQRFSHPKKITVDDIDNFGKVGSVKNLNPMVPHPESKFKQVLKRIFGEKGTFKDWGGEKNDFFTTQLRMRGKRFSAAFALKGKGTKGVLTPGKMGKNGDQIQRLFYTNADIFLVQYWGDISESLIEEMNAYAIKKSASNSSSVYYGVINGQDTQRILQAYQSRRNHK